MVDQQSVYNNGSIYRSVPSIWFLTDLLVSWLYPKPSTVGMRKFSASLRFDMSTRTILDPTPSFRHFPFSYTRFCDCFCVHINIFSLSYFRPLAMYEKTFNGLVGQACLFRFKLFVSKNPPTPPIFSFLSRFNIVFVGAKRYKVDPCYL